MSGWAIGNGIIDNTHNFRIYDNTNGAARVTVDGSGNVGIGTSGPAHLLEVNGNAANTTGVWATISDRQFKSNVNPIQNALEMVRRLQGVTFQWNRQGLKKIFSPKRMEHRNVKEFEPGVSDGLIRGFVAQDVEKVVPEWVKSDPRGFKWLEPAGIEAVMVEAIKAVDAENVALKEQVADQQKQLDALKTQLQNLQRLKP